MFFSFSTFAATEFKIRASNEKNYNSLKAYSKTDLVAIIAFGNYCPILRRHIPALNELQKTYQDKVTFMMLNSIKNMSDLDLVKEKKEFGLDFDIYQDHNLTTVKELGLTTLSEVVLLKVSTGEILYRGSINNQFTFDLMRQKPTENYLTVAIASSLKNEEVKVKKSKVFGCAISFN